MEDDEDLINSKSRLELRKIQEEKRNKYTNDLLDNIFMQKTCFTIKDAQIEQNKDVI